MDTTTIPALPTTDSEINPKLQSYIEIRDGRLVKKGHWQKDALSRIFSDLLKFRKVTVGGRAVCGNSRSMSWDIFVSWNEIVKKANSLGYKIRVEYINPKNSSPTLAGGWWNENNYFLENGV